MADGDRLIGLYGGAYRYRMEGRYRWRLLVPGAPVPQLSDRRLLPVTAAGRAS